MKKIGSIFLVLAIVCWGTIPLAAHAAAAESSPAQQYMSPGSSSSSGEAAQPASIIGSDDRSPVYWVNLTPYNKIVFIVSTFPDGQMFRGTGAIIGYDTVLTAAHLVYDQEHGGEATSVRVYLQVNGTMPSEQSGTSGYGIYYPDGYADDGDRWDDWACFHTYSDIGSTQGWFGFAVSDSFANKLTISGYPGTVSGSSSANYYMYTHRGYVTVNASNNRILNYTIDTGGGQSGSPIYSTNEIIYGVHFGGDGEPAQQNWGRRIDQTMFNILQQYKTEGELLYGN
jgi:glutamyl endopeptidase